MDIGIVIIALLTDVQDERRERMAINANAKIGFYTALGVLGALLVWNIISIKVPSFRAFAG